MNKTSKNLKSIKNNAKPKASSVKGVHKSADVKNAIKTKLNRRTKIPRGNNPQSKISAAKLSNTVIEKSKQQNKNYGYASQGRFGRSGRSGIKLCISGLGVDIISEKYQRMMENPNKKVNSNQIDEQSDQDDINTNKVQ